jgi:hypothetical protein
MFQLISKFNLFRIFHFLHPNCLAFPHAINFYFIIFNRSPAAMDYFGWRNWAKCNCFKWLIVFSVLIFNWNFSFYGNYHLKCFKYSSSNPDKFWNLFTISLFLAYFQILKKYAIVRTLSVRPCRYYFSGGWPILPVYGSIDSLWPQRMNQGRNFFWTDPSHHRRGPKSNF